MRRLLIILFLTTLGTGCGKIEKWRTERKAQQERIQSGIAQRRKFFEANLSPATCKTIPKDFYTYDGFRDWWRLPLVFPYQLLCIEEIEKARLEKYDPAYPVNDPNKSSSQIISDIIRLKTDNKMLLFESNNDGKVTYGLFKYSTGIQSTFDKEEDLWSAAKSADFSGTNTLISVSEFFNAYYDYEKKFVEQETKYKRQK